MDYVRVAKAVIRRRSDGKYLVLRCSEWPERPDRSLKPDLAGGAVEVGETFEEGVRREVQEETGIDLRIDEFRVGYANSFIYTNDEKPKAVVRTLYFCEVEDPEVVVSWEHSEYWWVSADELEELEWKQFYRDAFAFMRESGLIV